jgi:hypothetical protein
MFSNSYVYAISEIKTNPIILWNNLANDISKSEKLPPPEIARVMALLDVSIYDSINFTRT